MAGRQRDFPKANARAKRLRRLLTPAEKWLWKLVQQLEGFHFRSQSPIGPHVYDFCDHGHKLIVEVDGGIHQLAHVQERDAAKQTWAEAQGYVVVRVPNDAVFGTGEPAIALIKSAVHIRRTS